MCSLHFHGLHSGVEGGIPLFLPPSLLACARIILSTVLPLPRRRDGGCTRAARRLERFLKVLCAFRARSVAMSCACGNQPETTAPRLDAWLSACVLHVSYQVSMITRAVVCGAIVEGPLPTIKARAITINRWQSPIPRSGDRLNWVPSSLIVYCQRAMTARQTASSAFIARLALHVVDG